MKYALVIGTAVVLILTGCSTGPSSPAAKPFKTTYGDSAVTIANHIKGCKDVALSDVGDGTKSGLASAATCTLDGRKIAVDSFIDADSANMDALIAANKNEQYWSSGKGWAAFEIDDSLIQLQLTNNTQELAKYMFDLKAPAADVSGEKAAATTIASSLNGKVERYKP
ncbi:hypothetical protein [Frigoribacterium sp. UYMn621]|uniref:hypothetical protein n=1 Tax=Frigoribacterium sp. UYMn621 TaxID=3156343 RepID=UPI0033994D85